MGCLSGVSWDGLGGPFEADFVHERAYEPGGHFTDEVRVNLTTARRCRVLFVRWPRDYRGSRAPVEALLAAIEPRD